MKRVSFRDFRYDSSEDREWLAKWENDPEIRHLFLPFKDEAAAGRVTLADEISQRAPGPEVRGFHSMILWDGEPVGEMSCVFDVRHAFTQVPNTAWIGIVIGEARARGQGVASAAMDELENRARNMGAERIELGVFEHNTRARRFYEKRGYQALERVDVEVFWWEGRRWNDVRLLKTLSF